MVHTAGGHGVDDFNVSQKYNVPITVPVDDGGYLTELSGKYAGQKVWDANKTILADLTAAGVVLGQVHIKHQYPHCWRCHNPIIFRATEQWFCSIDAFKDEVYKAIDGVQWMPEWGHDRMYGMVRDRSDWCISRQRTWGVPIPAFYCKKCGKYHITDATIKAVSDLFRREGSDAWYKYEAGQIIPAGEVCENCGGTEWTKDTDIMDVWFDSGSTWSAVLGERPELRYPADLYMEGADQFRGWFQSSLLTSVASQGVAPYKSVLCHGWVVDEQGKQMHKSAGNGVEPSEIIKDYGADIIRLWVASSDYTVDVRAGKNIFKQLSEAYRKIRNTARFILGNLDGFDPNTDMLPDDQLQEIDRWALAALDDLLKETDAGYAAYNFNKVYHAIYNFCVVAMSNFYLDVTKDRLYCTNGAARQAAQTAMYKILVALDKIIAPILCFTSQEIWDFIPKTEGMNRYVVFEDMPHAGQYAAGEDFKAKWAGLIAVRDEVKKALETARKRQEDRRLPRGGRHPVLQRRGLRPAEQRPHGRAGRPDDRLPRGAGQGRGRHGLRHRGLGVAAEHASGDKCERCWKYTADIGSHPAHPTLCARCAASSRAELRPDQRFKIEERRSLQQGDAVLCKDCQGAGSRGTGPALSQEYSPMFVFLNLIAIAALVGIDQAIKLWAVQNLQPVGSMPLIPHVVELHFTYNEGMAFSLLWGRQEILIVATSIGMLLIAWWLFTHCRNDQLQRWALVLVLGGGIGNLIDRIAAGRVVDYINLLFMNLPCSTLPISASASAWACGCCRSSWRSAAARKQGRQSGRGQVTHGTA